MTLTTEQKSILIDTCNAMINRDATSDYSANLREVAKVALSVLAINQEPKAWYIRTDDSVTTDPAEAKMWVGIPLYAAPPAPANARPVAWEMRFWNSGHNMWGDWERITAELHAEMSVQHATDNDYEFRVLYDAPPAPAVPEKCPDRVRFLMNMHTDDLFGDADAQEIWNACRAAMLAAAPEGGNG